MDQYLVEQGSSIEPDFAAVVGDGQLTLCTPAVCKHAGHRQMAQQDAPAQQQRQRDDGGDAESKGAEESKSVPPREFLLCCPRMGNCLCEVADEFIVYNHKHGLHDPRHNSLWINENHPLFQHDQSKSGHDDMSP